MTAAKIIELAKKADVSRKCNELGMNKRQTGFIMSMFDSYSQWQS